MNVPKVSVIVPNYNHSAYLRQRIDSILNQTFTDFELILLDDCSTDSSREVLLSYRTSPFVSHIVLNDTNSGSTFVQWDRGLKLACGEYIWIAESDDFADPDFLRLTVEQLETHPNASIAFTGSYLTDADGANLPKRDSDKFAKDAPAVSIYKSDDYLRRKMLWGNNIYNASMVLFRKACYKQVSSDYRAFRYCGDWLFWSEICKQGDVISVNKKLNFFRQHLNKVSPGAEKEGLYFTEGGEVIIRMMDKLRLSNYQRKVVSGRLWKRVRKFKRTNKEGGIGIERQLKPRLLQSRYLSIMVYEFDKWFNLSRLQR